MSSFSAGPECAADWHVRDGGNTSPVKTSSNETSLHTHPCAQQCLQAPHELKDQECNHHQQTHQTQYFIGLISKEVKNQMKEELHSIISTIYEE